MTPYHSSRSFVRLLPFLLVAMLLGTGLRAAPTPGERIEEIRMEMDRLTR